MEHQQVELVVAEVVEVDLHQLVVEKVVEMVLQHLEIKLRKMEQLPLEVVVEVEILLLEFPAAVVEMVALV